MIPRPTSSSQRADPRQITKRMVLGAGWPTCILPAPRGDTACGGMAGSAGSAGSGWPQWDLRRWGWHGRHGPAAGFDSFHPVIAQLFKSGCLISSTKL